MFLNHFLKFKKNIFHLKVVGDFVQPLYLRYMLEALHGQGKIKAIERGSVQPFISVKEYLDMPLTGVLGGLLLKDVVEIVKEPGPGTITLRRVGDVGRVEAFEDKAVK